VEATVKYIKDYEHNQSFSLNWYKTLFLTFFILTTFLLTLQLDAEIYQWVDKNNVINYSNKSPANEENADILFDEYPHDEVSHLIRLNADQERLNALTEETNLEEQQAPLDEPNVLEEANQDQPQFAANECFSPSYSIQQGMSVYTRIVPRYIGEGEYLDIQRLFRELEGDWSGTGRVLNCLKKEGKVYEQVDDYSIRTEGNLRSRGQFVLKSTLQSNANWTTEDNILRLYLSEKILAENANLTVPDIELISVSPDELVYVRARKNRRVSGVPKFLEKVNTIKITSETSFVIERVVYLGGRLKSKSNWYLERR
jgi:hypothetical protein